jgi:hypothetical protein
LDRVAEIFQAGDEAVGLGGFGSAVEMGGPEIAIELNKALL